MFWKKNKTPKYQAPQITDATFNDTVLGAKIPVMLDFYADWCGPCKILGPLVDEVAEAYEGKAIVAKINTERNPKLSQHFKIKSIPTVIVINQDEMVERFQGIVPKNNLEYVLDLYISENNAAS